MAFLFLSVVSLGERYYIVYFMLIVLDVMLAIYITNKSEPSSYKLTWLVTISIFPLLGGLTYIFVKLTQHQTKLADMEYRNKARHMLVQEEDVSDELSQKCPDSYNISRYVYDFGLYPVCRNSFAEYYSLGEIQFEHLINEMEKAEKFIFLEFFIITKGYMFDTISDLLIRKAGEGVDVRLMYDGIGTGMLNSKKIFRRLIENGVKCKEFNPFRPMLSSVQNNRDHRKIVVIDGKTAFSGGTNLADEYINRIQRFGHWKDTGFMIKGRAVRNYTIMFLSLWEPLGEPDRYTELFPEYTDCSDTDGFIQPFSDSPLDDEPVGKSVYLELINNARDHVYITTPYLILDEEMTNALCFAAKKGVKVTIITPHIPDKWYVYMIAWNNYPDLISRGVEIYEYTPGFIHAKTVIADGKIAVIGTINFDYRSFYLHFESAALLYESSMIADMEHDIEETIKISQLITSEDCKKRAWYKKAAGSLLNVFAPLL
ncbi:MAG: cardiolipin synthase [Ruminococcus sp.]|nr:cardiolipin synthase [Ruminococcus sp.]